MACLTRFPLALLYCKGNDVSWHKHTCDTLLIVHHIGTFFYPKTLLVVEKPINQRIKFLLEHLKMSARDFSRAVGVADNNTQNYLEPRFAQPKAEYLERVLLHFESINPTWLLLGKGEPFLLGAEPAQTISNTKGKGNIIGQNITTAIGNLNLDDCRRELASSQKEVEHLKQQLELKDALLAAKEEMLVLLRGSHNRPN
jgi:hypothetical protein